MKRNSALIRQQSDAEFRATVAKRMKAMDAGWKVTEKQFLKMHKRLLATGR